MSHNNVENSNGKGCPIRILILGSGFAGIEVLKRCTKEISEKQQHRRYFGKPR